MSTAQQVSRSTVKKVATESVIQQKPNPESVRRGKRTHCYSNYSLVSNDFQFQISCARCDSTKCRLLEAGQQFGYKF